MSTPTPTNQSIFSVPGFIDALADKLKKTLTSMGLSWQGDSPEIDYSTVRILQAKPEKCELTDGVVYVIGSQQSYLANVVDECLGHLEYNDDGEERIFDYNRYCIDEGEIVRGAPLLYSQLGQCNVFIPLFTPNVFTKQYLAVRLTEENAAEKLAEMVEMSESICRDAMLNALQNIGMYAPDTFSDVMNYVTHNGEADDSCRDYADYSCDACDDIPSALNRGVGLILHNAMPSFGYMAMPSARPSKQHAELDYRTERKLFGRYLDNCKQLKRLLNYAAGQSEEERQEVQKQILDIRAETDYVLMEAGIRKKQLALFYRMFMEMPVNQRKHIFEDCLDRFAMAKNCPLTIEVCAVTKDEYYNADAGSTNGLYRVFIKNDNNARQITFKRRDSCIIYMMYLIDRKYNKQSVAALKLKEHEATFRSLYKEVYPPKTDDKGRVTENDKSEDTKLAQEFKNLFDTPVVRGSDDKYRSKQQYLKTVYADMRADIEKAVDALVGEDNCLNIYGGKTYSSPINVPNVNSHITIKPTKIIIPAEIKDKCSGLVPK